MSTSSTTHRLRTNTAYLTWLVSDTSKGLASALFGFAVPLLALIVTDDPAQAGIIAGAGMVARVLLTLIGGILADRHRRILLMLLGSILGVVLAGAFTLVALAGSLTFLTLLVIDVLLAARSGLFDVAGESALKEIVPDDAMGRAQAANQGRDAALQLTGGPLGGLLLGAGGWLVGAVMTLCHLVAAVTAGLLGRQVERAGIADRGAEGDTDLRATTRRPNAWREFREGFTWLLSRPDLGGVMLIMTIVNLGFNAAITTAVYALQQAGH
ncbi:MFS transporter, partial [Mycobacterium tuberculosis]|uniref:MFS transporter n=1 Tax=Mycobacterium tuberculosis TaxID=1773 RepID=UPI000A9E7099